MLSTFTVPVAASSSPRLRRKTNYRKPVLHFSKSRKRFVPVHASLSRQLVTVKPPPVVVDENDPSVQRKRNKEPEEVARRRNWVKRNWAPWEDVLTPEADFAQKSLDEGMQVPLTNPETVESFKMLTPSYLKKKIEEMGEEEYYRRLFAIKGEIPEKLKTLWAGPLALKLVPPRDWPPKGWEVDKAELAFIRHAHKLQALRVDIEGDMVNKNEKDESDWTAWSEPEEVALKRAEEKEEKKETVMGEVVEEKKETGLGEVMQKIKETGLGEVTKETVLERNEETEEMKETGLGEETEEKKEPGLGEYKELWAKFKEWAEENHDKFKTMGSKSTNPDDFLSEFKKWVDENREDGMEMEKAVEKAVERYDEFLKRYKNRAYENREINEKKAREKIKGMSLERYNMFLKQYSEWVVANRDRLEEESYTYDQDYYPGRRKRGKDFKEEMLELPFIYPGQIYQGKVVSLALHQGAFVDIGCVHDGWVPIKGNDWYWLRHQIEVGMQVMVEIIAKRDPYRYRFPIEMRLVSPNIDHLIFNRFDYPPIFHREEDPIVDEIRREGMRPPIPKKRPEFEKKIEEEPLVSNHPYVDELWRIHNAEQMILDHEDENPEEFADQNKTYEETVDPSMFDYDEEINMEFTQEYYDDELLPKTILHTSLDELNLDAARKERQKYKRLKEQAEEKGATFRIHKLRRQVEMDKYDLIHWHRSKEEKEALIRDISNRVAVGLPVEQPGKYNDDPKFWGNDYDKSNPLYKEMRTKNSTKKVRNEKEIKVKEKYRELLGERPKKWGEMSYEEFAARGWKAEKEEERERTERIARGEEVEEGEDDYDDGIDFDFRWISRKLKKIKLLKKAHALRRRASGKAQMREREKEKEKEN